MTLSSEARVRLGNKYFSSLRFCFRRLNRAGERGKRASNDHALAPERRTDTGRGIERGTETVTINTVNTSRKATNMIAAGVQRGQRTRSVADIANTDLQNQSATTDTRYYGMATYMHV